jgi:hypothetical protein
MSRVKHAVFTTVVIGDQVKILDANGKAIARVAKAVARRMAPKDEMALVTRIAWRQTLCGMHLSYTSRLRRQAQDDWIVKCSVWQKSLRWRRNRKPHARKTNMICGRMRTVCDHWGHACQLLLQQYANRYYEAEKRANQPWRLWAQTVYSNLNKRKDILNERRKFLSSKEDWQSDDFRTYEHRRASGVQVCFNWDRSHA